MVCVAEPFVGGFEVDAFQAAPRITAYILRRW